MSKSFKSSTATIQTDFSPSEFEEALARQAEEQCLEPGDKVSGVVVKLNDDELFIDINYKAEGRIPLSEFVGKMPVMGQEIEVIFKGEDVEGNVKVSFAELQRTEVEAQLQEGRILKAKVAKLITRKKENSEQPVPVGFEAELAPELHAFVPLSQIDIYPAPAESYIGSTLEFRIERIEAKGRHQNIVLNRRKLLEEALRLKQKEFFASHQVGDIIRGQVRSFVEFGAFIDLGGFSGLLHVMNMAWHPVKKAQDLVSLSDELELQISDLDPDKKKIGLSLKALQPNPWDNVVHKYHAGQILEGWVVRLQTYGAFVEIEPCIEGLIHISEMSWLKQIKHPKEVLNVGDQVKVQVLELDLEKHRIRLGLRQTQPNPWLSIADRYPVGTRLTLPVKNVVKSGAFLSIEEGLDGFLHQDDLSWAKRLNIHDIAKVGEQLEIQVLSVDVEERRIRLGVKQLESNPWQELKKYKKGTVIEGTVFNKAGFGIFVTVNGGIQGFIHKNDLSNDSDANCEELLQNFKKGDKVRTLIVEIDEKKRRLGLSIKALERSEEQQNINQYLVKNGDVDTGFTLGDILKR